MRTLGFCRPHCGTLIVIATAMAMVTAPAVNVDAAPATKVTGKVKLPAPKFRPLPPSKSIGFVARASNPLRAAKPYSPYNEMVVVLSGGPVAAADAKPSKFAVDYVISGETFITPLLAVIAGSRVLVRNRSRRPHKIVCTTEADAFADNSPINPQGEREIIPKKAETLYALVGGDTVHTQGAVVGFKHRYFAHVRANGTFSIKNVPPGQWKTRLWFRGKFADIPETVVTVGGRSTKVVVNVPAEVLKLAHSE